MKNDPLVKSGDLQGTTLIGAGDVKLGTVREIYLDLRDGVIRFALIDLGGFLGGRGKFHPVPWSMLRYDPAAKSFQTNIGKDGLKAAPSYDTEQLGSASYGWGEQVERYFNPDRLRPGAADEGPELRH